MAWGSQRGFHLVGLGDYSRTTLPLIPTNYDQLAQLYEIQSVLAQSPGIQQACDAMLPIVTRALRIRTAVLLDTTQELRRDFAWAAGGICPAELEVAREHARTVLSHVAHLARVPSGNVVSRTDTLPGGVAEKAVSDRCFVTEHLSPIAGDVFGLFQIEGTTSFDDNDRLFIKVVATQLGHSLDRHHSQLALEATSAKVERTNRVLHDLQTISKAALDGATLDESLSEVLQAMRSMFATDGAAVLLVSADGKTLSRRSSSGLEADDDLEMLVGTGAAGRIAATGTAMFFDDFDDLGVSPTLRSNGIHSLLGAPMRARNQVTGVVYVASRDRRGFNYDELQLLELVAARIGIIIDNANLYEKALAAIRSRDAVMSVVSHDLRNPLSAIQMSTELFATDDPKLTKPVSIIKRSVDTMTRLISDLRDVGSIEAGHLSISSRSEDASELVRDAIEGCHGAASKKSIRLVVRLPGYELALECDRIRAIQVLTNLLSNAIKFTPQDGSITISMAAGASGYARLSVEDTGCGIPEGDLVHVFDRYWQARDTAHLGTGLGLAIAKGIVEAHGGTMSVQSRVEHGTTFSFTLPLAYAPVARDHVTSQQTVATKTGARVLIVDDEPNALSALASLLGEEGFVVETAPDGLQALPKVREFVPDILIVDVEMPGLKGPDLARKIREDLTELPVILMTGHGGHAIASDQMELRASYIAKPIEINDLISAIHRELDKER